MSHAMAPSVMCSYGVIKVCQQWGLGRGTLSHQRSQIARSLLTPAKLRRQTAYTEVHERDPAVITASLSLGIGHRKFWACLRRQDIRTFKAHVLRLMRQAGLLAPSCATGDWGAGPGRDDLNQPTPISCRVPKAETSDSCDIR